MQELALVHDCVSFAQREEELVLPGRGDVEPSAVVDAKAAETDDGDNGMAIVMRRVRHSLRGGVF